MLASYASSRSFGLFFAFYVLLACFIFLNLIRGRLCESIAVSARRRGGSPLYARRYSASIKNEIRRKNEKRVEGLKAAFALLAQDDCISRKTFEELVKETNRVEKLPADKKGRGRLLLRRVG